MSRIKRRQRAGVLDPQTHARLIAALELGNRLSVACTLAGLKYQTVREWVERGEGSHYERPPTPAMTQLAQDIVAARARYEAGLVGSVNRGAKVDPRVAIWLLENLSPEWRQRQQPIQPADIPPPAAQVTSTTNVVFITEQQAREYGLERVREARRVSGGDDAPRLRPGVMVEDAPAVDE